MKFEFLQDKRDLKNLSVQFYPSVVSYGANKLGVIPVKARERKNKRITKEDRENAALVMDTLARLADIGVLVKIPETHADVKNLAYILDGRFLERIYEILSVNRGTVGGVPLFQDLTLKVQDDIDEVVRGLLTLAHYTSTYGRWELFGEEVIPDKVFYPFNDAKEEINKFLSSNEIIFVNAISETNFINFVLSNVGDTKGENNVEVLRDLSTILNGLLLDEDFKDVRRPCLNQVIIENRQFLNTILLNYLEHANTIDVEQRIESVKNYLNLLKKYVEISVPITVIKDFLEAYSRKNPLYKDEVLYIFDFLLNIAFEYFYNWEVDSGSLDTLRADESSYEELKELKNRFYKSFAELYHSDNNRARYFRRFFAWAAFTEKRLKDIYSIQANCCKEHPKIRRFYNENVRKHGHHFTKANKTKKALHKMKQDGKYRDTGILTPKTFFSNIGPVLLKSKNPASIFVNHFYINGIKTKGIVQQYPLVYWIRLHNYLSRALSGNPQSHIVFIRDKAVFTKGRTVTKEKTIRNYPITNREEIQEIVNVLREEIIKQLYYRLSVKLSELSMEEREELRAIATQNPDYFPYNGFFRINTTRFNFDSPLTNFGNYYKIPFKQAKGIYTGITWSNTAKGYCVDFDLHGVAIQNGGKVFSVGWDSGINAGPLMFSGDMTCAPKNGLAGEYIYLSIKDAEEFDINNIILFSALFRNFGSDDTYKKGAFLLLDSVGANTDKLKWSDIAKTVKDKAISVPFYNPENYYNKYSSIVWINLDFEKKVAKLTLLPPNTISRHGNYEVYEKLINYAGLLSNDLYINDLVDRFPVLKQELPIETLDGMVRSVIWE